MNKITIWSDFACPYCYIGERRLQDAIKELGWENKFETTYRAFELDPAASKEPKNISTIERLARKYGISEEKAKQRVEAINEQGRKIGIDFRFDSVKSSNTFDAHRLMKLAEAKYNQETVDKLNEGLFAAYFSKNENLSDSAVLLGIALEAGMKEEEVMKTLKTDEFAPEVRKDEQEASMRGIHGVPYIVFNNKYAVPGAVSIDDFKKILEEVFDAEPIENISSKAMSCDENGCSI